MFQGYLKVTQSCESSRSRSKTASYIDLSNVLLEYRPRSDAVCLHIEVKLKYSKMKKKHSCFVPVNSYAIHKELAGKQPRIMQRTCCRVNSNHTQEPHKKKLLVKSYATRKKHLLVKSYATRKELARKMLRERKIARKQLRHILWSYL